MLRPRPSLLSVAKLLHCFAFYFAQTLLARRERSDARRPRAEFVYRAGSCATVESIAPTGATRTPTIAVSHLLFITRPKLNLQLGIGSIL